MEDIKISGTDENHDKIKARRLKCFWKWSVSLVLIACRGKQKQKQKKHEKIIRTIFHKDNTNGKLQKIKQINKNNFNITLTFGHIIGHLKLHQ